MSAVHLLLPNLFLGLLFSLALPVIGSSFVARAEIAKFFAFQQLLQLATAFFLILFSAELLWVTPVAAALLVFCFFLYVERFALRLEHRQHFFFVLAGFSWASTMLLRSTAHLEGSQLASVLGVDLITAHGTMLQLSLIFMLLLTLYWMLSAYKTLKEDFDRVAYGAEAASRGQDRPRLLKGFAGALVLSWAVFTMGDLASLSMALVLPFAMYFSGVSSLKAYLRICLALSFLGTFSGFALSFSFDLPTAPSIVLLQTVLAVGALLLLRPVNRSRVA